MGATEMILTDIFSHLQNFVSLFISPSSQYHFMTTLGIALLIVLFVLRTLIIFITRLFGLYHINHYHYWPRLPWRTAWKIWMVIYEWWQEVFTFGTRST